MKEKVDMGPELIDAAEKGDLAHVKFLIASGADVNARDSSGWTALMAASQAGRTEAVRALIEAKADVNAGDEPGVTVLMAASSS
ncbi:MAG TPA: ankyrin repeat domain-containing protein, partial [Syntrophorhabdaceae bacterium]|nr:ankyrin repeat domain-containing protein [Syntrophorhabdaceae bacterium]